MNSADVCEPRKSDSGRGGKRYLALGWKSLTPGERKEIVLAARRHERSRSYSTGSIRARAPRKRRGEGATHGISGPRPREAMGWLMDESIHSSS